MLDQRPAPSEELRRRIVGMRASGWAWKTLAAELGIAESTAIYRQPHRRPADAALLTGRRHPDARRVTRQRAVRAQLRARRPRPARAARARRQTPAGVRRVDTHDDLQEELAAYKAARSETWKPEEPALLNARGKRWTRNAIAQHVIPPALEEANRQRARTGLPAIRDDVTPHTLRYTCIASLFAAGADQEYVAAQVGHEDVTTTNRIYRYVLQRRQRGEIGRRRQLAMHESAAEVGAAEGVATRARAR